MDVVGKVSKKSNLVSTIIDVNEDSNLSMTDYLIIKHPQMDKDILCQVSDIRYKEVRGKEKLLATLNILKRIPNPFPPKSLVYRAENGIVASTLNIREEPNHIHIGKLIGHDINVYLDPNTLILKHMGVLGKTGAGKTYTVRVVIEELIKHGITSVIIDPHDDYSFMAEYYQNEIVLLNPEIKNYGLECDDIKKIYHEDKITIINLKDWEEDGQCELVRDASYRLFKEIKKGTIKPFMFAVDECHRFAPQVHKVSSSSIMATILSEGRKFGMGVLVCTQRPASISKNVLSQCNTYIILKVTNPNDIRAIMGSIEGIRKEDKSKLQMLESGTGQALIIGSNIKMPQYVQIKKTLCGDVKPKRVI